MSFYNDICVDSPSQLGEKSINNVDYKFKGFDKYQLYYDSTKDDIQYRVSNMFAVAHNVEPYDPDIIKIVKNVLSVQKINEENYNISFIINEENGTPVSASVFHVKMKESTTVTIPNLYEYIKDGTTYNLPVKSILDNAFYGKNSLTGIVIPVNVETIGEMAFAECYNLLSVNFATGSELTTIGANAFINCVSLTNYSIPNSVQTIGEKAFFRCPGPQTLNIPSSVTTIGNGAFAYCSNVNRFTSQSSCYPAYDGILTNSSETVLIQYPIGRMDVSLDLDYYFVEEIGDYAFAGMTSLNNIRMSYVTAVGVDSFRDCVGLQTLDTYYLEEIGDNAFENTGVYIVADGFARVGDIGISYIGKEKVFYMSSLPYSITSLSAGFFTGSAVEEIIIDRSNIKLGANSLSNISGLTAVKFIVKPNNLSSKVFGANGEGISSYVMVSNAWTNENLNLPSSITVSTLGTTVDLHSADGTYLTTMFQAYAYGGVLEYDNITTWTNGTDFSYEYSTTWYRLESEMDLYPQPGRFVTFVYNGRVIKTYSYANDTTVNFMINGTEITHNNGQVEYLDMNISPYHNGAWFTNENGTGNAVTSYNGTITTYNNVTLYYVETAKVYTIYFYDVYYGRYTIPMFDDPIAITYTIDTFVDRNFDLLSLITLNYPEMDRIFYQNKSYFGKYMVQSIRLKDFYLYQEANNNLLTRNLYLYDPLIVPDPTDDPLFNG